MCDAVSYHTIGGAGLRLVHIRRPDARVEIMGAAVDSGSRDEPADLEGLAHFVEHTIFKGTHRRRAWHILNRMESVGGELNAYTTKEHTVIYTVAPAGNMARSVDLVADLMIDSQFPTPEIDREREVVADEINSYLDSPAEAIFDDFDELMFVGSPLAHNILGSTATIARIDSAACRRYLATRFTAGRTVVFYSGPASVASVTRRVESCFASIPATPGREADIRCAPAIVAPFAVERDLGLHQSHTLMGARIGSADSSDRYAMALLTNILGGPGMNSLLNVALRERRGLVYSIDASTALMSDCGLFAIYFGCDRSDTARCRRLVENAIARLADGGMTDTALSRAKRQYIGQLVVAGESHENSALAVARATLMRGHATPPAVTAERINAVTAVDLRRAAESIAPGRLSTLTLF